jgi:tyrosyl-tRNA synthetase
VDIDDKIALIKREPTEEIVTEEELRALLSINAKPKHYIGLEISGLLHLGSLILTGYKINDMLKAGINCTVFLADWHTFINDKLGGDWRIINEASSYYAKAFKFFCKGVNVALGSELYDNKYWEDLVRFSKHITLVRTLRSLTIMGRSEKDRLDFAQLLYPPMQAVDIHALDLDIVHAGMDQRKVHMLVREVFPKLGWKVPITIHHHLLPGLGEPTTLGLDEDQKIDSKISSKMSKSKPWTSIFIHDAPTTIKSKLKKAWCPEGVIENNPVLEIARYIIFHEYEQFTIERPSKYGGDITFYNYKELEEAFSAKKLHPMDLKNGVSRYLNEIIDPVRRYLENEPIIKVIENL